MNPLYLCGFMGCGKSRIGRLLAKELAAVFIDLDRYIVNNEGMTIPEIFEKKGEPFFRDTEAEYIKNFSGRTVVATGGGAMLRDETAEFARKNGTVFFIDVSFDTCYNRIKNDSNRPLVVNNSRDQLKEIFDRRFPVYKKNSDYTIDGERTDKEIAKDIIDILKENGRV